jgi:adenylate cyclase
MTASWRWLRGVGRKHLAGILAGLAIVGLVELAGLAGFGAFEGLEYWSLDRFFELRGQLEPTLPVVIVTIDESTFTELHKQWPFARALHAQLIRNLMAGKPRLIAFDVIFDTPSSAGPEDDNVFAEAIASAGNVVLAAAFETDEQRDVRGDDGRTFKVDRGVTVLPLEMFTRGAAAVAAINAYTERGAYVRRVGLQLTPDDRRVPPMPLFDAALHTLLAKSRYPVAPLPKTPVLIYFRGKPNTYPWFSYHRVLRGEVDAAEWKDKIVLIGPTSPILQDLFATPFAGSRIMPGVEIHANALETLVRGDYIREMPPAISIVLAFLAAIVGCALVVRLRAFGAFLAVVGVWVLLTAAAFVAFVLLHLWIRGMLAGTVAVALGLGYFATVVEHFVREQRDRRRLQQFFSPDVAREVMRHKDEGSLTTRRRLVTVLFSDIRGFTTLSEQLQPEQVAEMLREYLSAMTEIVFRYEGTVDKYVGDCVMALYNAPLEDPEHAVKAVRTALEFQERTLALSARWEQKLGITIRNGVGINTGEAVVGTLGSKQRLEYTAIGDTINLGARLESLTKDYTTNIIISESTYALVKDHFVTKELGDVTVKGKTQPVKIYAVLPSNIRKHPRATLDAAATLTMAGHGRTCRVRTHDISEGGMALTGVPDDWMPGQAVQVRCEGGALPNAIVVDAVIAWRRGDQVGVSFTSLDSQAGPMVAEYVSRAAK